MTKLIKACFVILFPFLLLSSMNCTQNKSLQLVNHDEVTNGSERVDKYLNQLKNKNVAVVANQSSMISNVHMIDSLISLNINIIKIFCPEHGLRGVNDAGQKISDNIDEKTNIPILSLYGSHKKPTADDLRNIDIVLFDLQDVGTRFYTYISTLTYVMEACAENNIPIIVLDRPNPNGFMIDGPVMEEEHQSFIGLHPVPVVYGMTIGEYAMMVAGEQWINKAYDLDLEVIPLIDYNHNMIVKLKIRPSPNLPNWQSVYLYPSLCFFEGTIISVGRGTELPFQVYGHPDISSGNFIFTPKSKEGASDPKLKDEICNGENLQQYANRFNEHPHQINLQWIIETYQLLKDNHDFFNNYFVKLAGTETLRIQIESGLSQEKIQQSWQPGINNFKNIRSKYLLYP